MFASLTITVPTTLSGLTINELLQNKWLLSSSVIEQLQREKRIVVDGHKHFDWKTYTVTDNSQIEISLPIPFDFPVVPTEFPLTILYEDEHVIIVNKIEGRLALAVDETSKNTLQNGVEAYLRSQEHPLFHAYAIHDLEQDISGAVIFAKHPLILNLLLHQLQQKQLYGVYWTKVDSVMGGTYGKIQASISEEHDEINAKGTKAITHYEIIKRDRAANTSILEITIDTAIKHQIRLHLDSIGYPIKKITIAGMKRPLLHLKELHFHHPFMDQFVKASTPIPFEFE
ncbi:pseudouridine synthase [Brochothrix thermosphacta]|uniref:pseudouridine synthase n=1 Tax=Brochothrix thermosphacta TaxID=2756 RepID=UPI00083FBB9F|nr:pseudouridine synthase [Brochothrix thermosphacta]ODJ62837.1 hypothetical protein BFR37_03515 [Brochothrix thermosphacta]